MVERQLRIPVQALTLTSCKTWDNLPLCFGFPHSSSMKEKEHQPLHRDSVESK